MCTAAGSKLSTRAGWDGPAGGCNEQNTVQHILLSPPPRIFTIQLAWQSNNEKGTDIKQAMEGLTEVSFVEQLHTSFVAFMFDIMSLPIMM